MASVMCVAHVVALQVFHMERSSNSLLNLQNTLPLFRCGVLGVWEGGGLDR